MPYYHQNVLEIKAGDSLLFDVMYLQTGEYQFFVIEGDIGIITKGKPESMLQYTAADIEAATYEDFDRNREQWLNLKKPEYFFQYFDIRDPRQNKLRKVARKMLVAAKVLPPVKTS